MPTSRCTKLPRVVIRFFLIFFYSKCVCQVLAHPSCFDTGKPYKFITSFNSIWVSKMNSLDKSYDKTVLQSHDPWFDPLIVYHEDDIPDFNGVCKINLFNAYPWLHEMLSSPHSMLNKYYKIATFFDPASAPKVGGVKMGHVLMLKVASIYHAVSRSTPGTLVFWVDTDVSLRKPFPQQVVHWLSIRDVTYIPFVVGGGMGMFANFNSSDFADESSRLFGDFWHVETGLFAVSVNERTVFFLHSALAMYTGKMYFLAKACFNNASFCHLERYKSNLYLNDVFVFSLLLHCDIHVDPFFHCGLRHGWFAMGGVPAWGDNNAVWGNHFYPPYFTPSLRNDSLVTNFQIGEYVFHHFGYHERGGLSMQLHHANTGNENHSGWRTISDPGEKSNSLQNFLSQIH